MSVIFTAYIMFYCCLPITIVCIYFDMINAVARLEEQSTTLLNSGRNVYGIQEEKQPITTHLPNGCPTPPINQLRVGNGLFVCHIEGSLPICGDQ